MITRSALSPTRSTRSTRSALSPTLSCSTRSPCSAVSPLIRPAHSAPLRSRSQVDEKLKKEIDDGEGEAKGLETTVEANEGALAADEKVGKADEDDAAKEDTQQIDGRRECVAAEASVVDLPAAWGARRRARKSPPTMTMTTKRRRCLWSSLLRCASK
jgi:hypothetical protein